jgi:hypothetical protein
MRLAMRRWLRITISLAAAVALHALLLWPLPRKQAARREPPLRVELVPHLPPQRAKEAAPQKPAPKTRTATPAANKSGRENEGEIASENELEHGPARWSREWTEQEGVARGGGLTLQLNNSLFPGPPSAAAPPAPDEKSVVQHRIQGWASDTKARQRAEVPDEYWRTVRIALERGFNPDREMLVRARPLESWQRQAEAYGKTGNPFAGNGEPGSRNESRGLDSVSLGGFPQYAINLGVFIAAVQGGEHRLVALVRISQHDDGTLLGVELAATSGSAAYDKLALKQARSLDELHLGAPRQGAITLWAFETVFASGPQSHIRLEAIY